MITTLLLVHVVTMVLVGQNDEATRKLQIAQSLEQAGDWQQASGLYEDLWRQDTANYVYFDALRRAYTQLKEHEKAIAVIEHRLRIRPTESYLAAYLGGVYFDAGRRPAADSVWMALLASAPKQRQLYVAVAQQMQERRLFGRAIETFQKGREVIGAPAEFAQELAFLHSATQSYEEAVGEYLRILEQTPHQLGYVQSRIASFTIRDEGLKQAERAIARAISRRPSNVQFKTLYAWVLMEQEKYPAALKTYRELDALSSANGAQLFNFAETAVRDGKLRIAVEAYSEIIMAVPQSSLRPHAMLGMAQAYERLSTVSVPKQAAAPPALQPIPETAVPADSALELYSRIMKEYPGSQPALLSLFRIGILRYERYADLDGALRALGDVRANPRSGILAWDALLAEADVLIARGDLPGARTLIQQAPQQARTYLAERLVLKEAWVEYLVGSFTAAQSILGKVIGSLNKDAANDGLTLYYFIQEGSADSSSLVLFARGELLIRQRKYSEALEIFRAVGRTARTAMLASRSRLESADMLVRLGKEREAIQLLDSIVTNHRTDVFRDRALFRIGTVYEERMGDTERARETYERFLALFPHSLFAEEARRRARALRSDPS